MQNVGLSTLVAVTGIAVPIALSFLLAPLAGATMLQCFAAGAALSATSLGTTFTILASAGIADTRLGTILTSAAMMDDVVGLVMIQAVASLGGAGGVSAAAIGRPIGASFGLLATALVGGWGFKAVFGTRPILPAIRRKLGLPQLHEKMVAQTGLLLVFVVAANYAGASVLFAAFLAGALVGWWDEAAGESGAVAQKPPRCTGVDVFEHFYQPVNRRILTPFFFASIGFSIPVTDMFRGSTVWKGIVYSLVMVMAKLVTGGWLLPVFSKLPSPMQWFRITLKARAAGKESPPSRPLSPPPKKQEPPIQEPEATTTAPPKPPKSLYPSAMLGLAMVARGEVAFLIASVAQGSGIFETAEELYLVVIWAAMVCTIVGPLGVGTLVRRVKLLEKKRKECGAPAEGVLGAWGVDA